jgi:hypothetical protein
MRNPKAMTSLHDLVKCSGHAANGLNTFNSPASALMLKWLTVCDNDKPVAVELCSHEFGESVATPNVQP